MSCRRRSILLVDDEEVYRFTLAVFLARNIDAELLTAKETDKALRLFAQSGAAISLIICDFRMFPLDGVEFLRALDDVAHKPAGAILYTILDVESIRRSFLDMPTRWIKPIKVIGKAGNESMIVEVIHEWYATHPD